VEETGPVRLRPPDLLRRLAHALHAYSRDGRPAPTATASRRVILMGSPNVGKSVVFNHLTGRYAVVSNYPGTTVEVSRGHARIGDVLLEVLDSPGSYSLAPFSEDERVTQTLLMEEPLDLVVHVADAKSLRRMLPLTFQLIEAGLPLVLDVNMIDEAQRAGLTLEAGRLAEDLGLPVAATAATTGQGMDELEALLAGDPPGTSTFRVEYPEPIESAAAAIENLLRADYGLARRALALLLLQRDESAWEKVTHADPEAVVEIERLVSEVEQRRPPTYAIAVARYRAADRIAARALVGRPTPGRRSFRQVLGSLAMHPLAGIPMLAVVLYFGLYLFVGRLGAGVLVDWLDGTLFGNYLNPPIEAFVHRLLPWPVAAELFVGEYGVITLGLRYAIAIVLPLVGAFFLMFALLEDTGYLPRLALLVDRIFKRIGLSGRAVIPIVLGFGCDTMATLVTRVLQTRRERLIATFLLALAIPCSAQLGVILGLLSGHPLGLAIWGGVVAGVFLLSGFLAAQLLPGETARFYLEIPPMRWPSLRNVTTKTLARLKWYAAEVIPIFLAASVVIWIGQVTRLFQVAVAALRPVVNLIGLPDAAADAFLFGFFRRDYGAARIFDIHSGGAVSGVPLVVAMVTITLFVPCVAQFLVMIRERGLRTALAVAGIILPFAFGVGYVLNVVLTSLRVQL
jgi:ferrous iron transport protein B